MEIKFRLKTASGQVMYLPLTKLLNLAINAVPNADKKVEVSQLVGYDKNGDEVYEGDVLEFDTPDLQDHTKVWHYEYTAHMQGFATTADGCYIPCEKFKERTLQKC